MAIRKSKAKPPLEVMETKEDLKEGIKMAMDYKNMKIEDIIDWCKENDEVAWLKAAMNTKVPYKQFPKKKIVKLDENGQVVVNKKGKIVYTSVADKSKPAKTVMRKPNFMHIKNAFVERYMPELKPVAQPKKPTMYDKINNL